MTASMSLRSTVTLAPLSHCEHLSPIYLCTFVSSRMAFVALVAAGFAGFIGATASMIPQIAGIDFDEFIKGAMGGKLDLSKPLLDYEIDNDVITIYLELEKPGDLFQEYQQ